MLKMFLFLFIFALFQFNEAGFRCHNQCSGHGRCSNDDVCHCQVGYDGGAADCSLRTCPSGYAWADKAYDVDKAHSLAECSNAGLCNRVTGTCKCFDGFEGSACDRMMCSGDPTCGGHGVCQTIGSIYRDYNALDNNTAAYSLWERNQTTTCVCDPGYTGGQCEFRMCPKGDDPTTPKSGYYTIKIKTWQNQYSSPLSGMFKFIFQGQSFNFPANVPSWNMTLCNKAFQQLPNIQSVNCSRNGTDWVGGGTTYTVQILSYPTLPYENNLWSHSGRPGANSDFACDSSSVTGGSTFGCSVTVSSKSATTSTPEYVYCSNRGLCDLSAGTCSCYTGYSGSACDTYSTESTKGDAVDILKLTATNPDFKANILHFANTMRGVSAWKTLKIDNSTHRLVSMDGYGNINMSHGGIHIKGLDGWGGMSVQLGGIQVTGGLTVSDSGVNLGPAIKIDMTDSGVRLAGGLTVSAGGMRVKSSGVNIANTGLTVQGNGLKVTGAVNVTSGGMTIGVGAVSIVGSVTVGSGGLLVNTHNKGITISNNGLNIRAGGLSVKAVGLAVYGGGTGGTDGMVQVDGTVRVTSNMDPGSVPSFCPVPTPVSCPSPFSIISDGGVGVAGGLTVSATGIKVTGGLTIGDTGLIAPYMTVTAGGLAVLGGFLSNAGLTISVGGLKVNGGLSIASGVVGVTGGLSVLSGDVSIAGTTSVSGDISAPAVSIIGGISIAVGGLSVISDGIAVTGGLTVATLELSVTAGGVQVADDAIVSGAFTQVKDVGVSVIGGLTITSSGLVVADGMMVGGGMIVQAVQVSQGAAVTDGVTARAGLSVTGGVSIAADGLKVTATGVTVATDGLKVLVPYDNYPLEDAGPVLITGGLYTSHGFSVNNGGMVVVSGGTTVSAGGVDVTGGLVVSSGGLSVTLGGVQVSSVGVTVTGGMTITTGDVSILEAAGETDQGALGVGGGGLSVSAGVTIVNGGLYVAANSMASRHLESQSQSFDQQESLPMLEESIEPAELLEPEERTAGSLRRRLLNEPSPKPSAKPSPKPSSLPTVKPTPVPTVPPTPGPTMNSGVVTVTGGVVASDGLTTDYFTYPQSNGHYSSASKPSTDLTIIYAGGVVTGGLNVGAEGLKGGLALGCKFTAGTGGQPSSSLSIASTTYGQVTSGTVIIVGGNSVTLSSCSLLASFTCYSAAVFTANNAAQFVGSTLGSRSTTLHILYAVAGTIANGAKFLSDGNVITLTGCSIIENAGTCTMDRAVSLYETTLYASSSVQTNFLSITSTSAGTVVDGMTISVSGASVTLSSCSVAAAVIYAGTGGVSSLVLTIGSITSGTLVLGTSFVYNDMATSLVSCTNTATFEGFTAAVFTAYSSTVFTGQPTAVFVGGTGGIGTTTLVIAATTAGAVTNGMTIKVGSTTVALSSCSITAGAGSCLMDSSQTIEASTTLISTKILVAVQSGTLVDNMSVTYYGSTFILSSCALTATFTGHSAAVFIADTGGALSSQLTITSTLAGTVVDGMMFSYSSTTITLSVCLIAVGGTFTCTMTSAQTIPEGTSLVSITSSPSYVLAITATSAGTVVDGMKFTKNSATYTLSSCVIVGGASTCVMSRYDTFPADTSFSGFDAGTCTTSNPLNFGYDYLSSAASSSTTLTISSIASGSIVDGMTFKVGSTTITLSGCVFQSVVYCVMSSSQTIVSSVITSTSAIESTTLVFSSPSFGSVSNGMVITAGGSIATLSDCSIGAGTCTLSTAQTLQVGTTLTPGTCQLSAAVTMPYATKLTLSGIGGNGVCTMSNAKIISENTVFTSSSASGTASDRLAVTSTTSGTVSSGMKVLVNNGWISLSSCAISSGTGTCTMSSSRSIADGSALTGSGAGTCTLSSQQTINDNTVFTTLTAATAISGGASFADGLFVLDSGLSLAAGAADGLKITGGVASGTGMTVGDSGLWVQASGVTVTGGFRVTNGGIYSAAGLMITGGMSLKSAGMAVSGGITVSDSGLKVGTIFVGGTGGIGTTTLVIAATTAGAVTNGMTIKVGSTTVALSSCSITAGAGSCLMDSSQTIEASTTFIATNSITKECSTTIDSNQLTVTGGSSIIVAGQVVTGTGIPFGTYVTQVLSETIVYLSKAATVTSGSASLAFTQPAVQVDSSGLEVEVEEVLSVTGGLVSLDNGFTVGSGAAVAGGLTVANSGVLVSKDGLTVASSGVSVMGDLVVDVSLSDMGASAGLNITGGLIIGTVITTISAVSFTISTAATSSGTVSLSFNNGATTVLASCGTTIGSETVTVADTTGLVVGMIVTGAGIFASSGMKIYDYLQVDTGVVIAGDLFVGGGSYNNGGLTLSEQYTIPSDERLKTNISLIDDCMAKLAALEPVYYSWSDEFARINGYELGSVGNGRHVGFIAQNAVEVLPEAVKVINSHGHLGVQYISFTPVVIEAIKELADRVVEGHRTREEMELVAAIAELDVAIGRAEAAETFRLDY